MNKQEIIKKLESIKAIGNDAIAACYNESMNAGITLMKKIDEPQKPVVTKFVAEWFEDNKHALDLAIFTKIRELDGKRYPHETDFENWLDNAENNPIETLIRMKDGYKVEKVLKYIVKIGKLYLKEPLGDTSNSTILTTWDKKCAYPFSSFHMADKHADKFEGAVEEVAEG
ncbi:DUF1642 domain-containing protein [Enterococcus faecium]|nr:DUF1642 domain-containing protein [Enterococcus faecium]